MDLTRKLQLLESGIRSIAEHDDAPVEKVRAALDQAQAMLARHAMTMEKRRHAKAKKAKA